MMGKMSLTEIAKPLAGAVHQGDCAFSTVSTDTRTLHAGDLFVALVGDNFNAHNFLAKAEQQQACGLIVQQYDKNISLPQLVVDDTTKALGKLAWYNRQQFAHPVLGITGSCGKTTVKTLLASILSEAGPVHATRGNLNNHIGAPLTLLDLNSSHDYAVVELGASGMGEIAYLASLLEPDVAVVTNAMHAHVEGFGSIENVAQEKGEIYTALKGDGIAVINIDDPFAGQWVARIGQREYLTFSALGQAADFSASSINESNQGQLNFKMQTPAGEIAIELQLLGRQNIANALAAAACAHSVGAGNQLIQAGLKKAKAVAGRMQATTAVNGCLLIDDSYNANPDSVKAAVDALVRWQGKKILVLGDLAELGKGSTKHHRELGRYARAEGVDELITVGSQARLAGQTFGENNHHFQNHESAAEYLLNTVDEQCVVLIKGSRSSHMEEVVKALATSCSEHN